MLFRFVVALRLDYCHALPDSDDDFDVEEARVICRQLGYSDGMAVSANASFGQGTGPIWLDELRCNSSDHTFLQDCPHGGWGTHNCGHKEDAGVVCLSKFKR